MPRFHEKPARLEDVGCARLLQRQPGALFAVIIDL